jgi:DNA-binding SARP family transcriptional activator
VSRTLILKLLGSPQLSLDEKPITQFISRKAQALLIYIAVTGKLHSREVIAELFWQDMPSSQSMKNLRTVLSNLRQLVGDYVLITRQTIAFNQECSYYLDVEAIRSIVDRPTTDHFQSLSESVSQYQGDFLEGFYVPDAPGFENWTLMERERLRELVIERLQTLAEHYLKQQNYAGGLTATRKLLTIDPWRETAHRQQMVFLAYTGQRHAALAQYNTCHQILADEFGVEPMAETTALYERIRVGDICEPNATEKASPKGKEEHSTYFHKEASYNVESSKKPASLPPVLCQFPIGPLPLSSPLYIDRTPIEQDAWTQVEQPGGLVRIKAPHQMGKTSLILRILANATARGYQTVRLNLSQADPALLANPDKFLRWFCAVMTEQLGIQQRLDDYWDLELGSKVSCTNYFRRYLLLQMQTPLVLALDELDQLFEHLETAQTFLPLLRFWYEEATESDIWQKLRLVVAHSTELYVPLNLNQSPFNVGLPIKLREFDESEVAILRQRHGLDEMLQSSSPSDINSPDSQSLAQLVALVGGHPCLLNMAFHSLAQGKSLSQVLQTATDPMGIYSSHLRQHLMTLQSQPQLRDALETIVMADHAVPIQPLLAYQLDSMGLIKITSEGATPSCKLYQFYFQNYLKNIQSTVIDSLKLSSHDNSLHAIA